MTTSSASLNRSPRKNWIEQRGGELPPYIRKIARAIHEKRGIPLDEAIPFAIGRIKRWAAGGDNVTAETKAKAVAAIAAWEKLKGKAKLTEAAAHEHDDDALGIPTALLLAWADEVDDVAPLVEAGFDEILHPRDRTGKFAHKAALRAMSVGQSKRVGNAHVLKLEADKFDVRPVRNGSPDNAPRGQVSLDRAASIASVDHGGAETPTGRGQEGQVVGSSALGNRRVKGTPEQERARGERNARMATVRANDAKAPRSAVERFGQDTVDLMNDVQLGRKSAAELTPAQAKKVAKALEHALRELNKSRLTAYDGARARLRRSIADVKARATLVEAAASSATPPSRLNVRLKSGRTVNVTADHARRLHRQGFAATDQRPGAGGGKFDEAKHPRGGKGSTSGGKFVAKGAGGTEVRAIQRRVGARVDGAFGDKTKAAVERFQRKHGLKVDGIVGRQTVAALRGRTDAKRVKVGKLSDRDRAFLTGHIRGRGGKRRTTLVEAVAPAAFLDRVQALEAGELARLPDGGAVKHEMTPDGREVWTSGRPSTYSPDSMSWDDQRRTVEVAVADALTRSAGATDPASLGGATRWTGTRCTVSGKPGRFVGVTATAGPLVRFDGEDDPTGVGWGEIVPTPRLVEASSAQT